MVARPAKQKCGDRNGGRRLRKRSRAGSPGVAALLRRGVRAYPARRQSDVATGAKQKSVPLIIRHASVFQPALGGAEVPKPTATLDSLHMGS